MKRIPLAVLLLAMLSVVTLSAQTVSNAADDYTTLQAAIDSASAGDVLVLSGGTFAPTATILINKALTLRGSTTNTTVIDMSSSSGIGLHVTSSNVTLEHLTVTADENTTYGIKVTPLSDSLSLTHISVSGSNGTVIDLNGVAEATIDNVSVSGSLQGQGLSMSSCQNITLDHITSTDNMYGDIVVVPADEEYQQAGRGAPSGIHFGDSLTLSGPAFLSNGGEFEGTNIPPISVPSVIVQNGSIENVELWNPTVGSAGSDADVIFNDPWLWAAGASNSVGHMGWLVTDSATLFLGMNILYQLSDSAELVAEAAAILGIDATLENLQVYDLNAAEMTVYAEGCMDPVACNYDSMATYPATGIDACWFAEEGEDCNGDCLADVNANGICDVDDVLGCTYAAACNFLEAATMDDGSCLFVGAGYGCDGMCLEDTDNDGVCDPNEMLGCTDIEAVNYTPLATDDDGSCSYGPSDDCPADLNGDGNIGVTDLLNFLTFFGTDCP